MDKGIVEIITENFIVDLSDGTPIAALSRDKEFTARFLNEFQDRLYFGTDLCNIITDIKPMVKFFDDLRTDGRISKEVHEKIMYRNAQKLLGL